MGHVVGRVRSRLRGLADALLGALAAGSLVGCASERVEPVASGDPSTWSYDVRILDRGRRIAGRATFPAGATALVVGAGAAPFVRSLEVRAGERWRELATAESDRERWPVRSDAALTVRWTFDVEAAASALRDSQFGRAVGTAFLASPSTWLVRPSAGWRGKRAVLRVREGERARFATGITAAGAGVHEFAAARIDRLPYTVLGDYEERAVPVPGGTLTVALLPGERALSADDVFGWVEHCALAVADFYGRFPCGGGLVIVEPRRRGGGGRTLGNGGAAVHYRLDRDATRADLAYDWVLVHELIHFACPLLAREHNWLEEGLATYVEPLVRVRSGDLGAARFWADFVRMMPYGLPRPGDRGLDRTRTWGRIYWGGALYCLLADLEIRERTDGRQSLADALRAILDAGHDIRSGCSMEELLRSGDRALEVPVLEPLWRRMRDDPHPVDLDALWERLGVRVGGRAVTFDDDAPWAAIRQAIASEL